MRSELPSETAEVPGDEHGLSAWRVRADDYPVHGPLRDQLAFCVRYAVLAPSAHNTQPWKFRVWEHAVEVRADRARALPVVDPFDRELVVSCGAALCNLSLAITRFGNRAEVEVLPEASDPDLLARVVAGPSMVASPLTHLLFDAIVARRTNRQVFECRAIDPHLFDALRRNTLIEGAWLEALTGAKKDRAAELIEEADRLQMRDTHFRRELSAWTNGDGSLRRDGVRGQSTATHNGEAGPDTLVVRTFQSGPPGRAACGNALASGSPLLCVLGTEHEEPAAWIAAGQALERLWLCATVAGLSVSFLNQPIEVPSVRSRLRQLLGRRGFPQLLLRVGYGRDQRPTPRRDLTDVLLQPEIGRGIA